MEIVSKWYILSYIPIFLVLSSEEEMYSDKSQTWNVLIGSLIPKEVASYMMLLIDHKATKKDQEQV